MASTSYQPTTLAFCLADIKIRACVYHKAKILILDRLGADFVSRGDIFKEHSSVEVSFGDNGTSIEKPEAVITAKQDQCEFEDLEVEETSSPHQDQQVSLELSNDSGEDLENPTKILDQTINNESTDTSKLTPVASRSLRCR
ncbi:hypothetical protein J6590_027527 [Homalodisca vitripennis]|nr:hypothetical protein J6590_027527 [Homalodisca vitripennis]